MIPLKKLISGGQTGADRAALDFAIASHLPHGGWCPHGRTAEDGPIDWRYRLKETPSPSYAQRTEWNVRDSDGTLIITIGEKLSGGSKLSQEFAKKMGRPCLHISQAATPNPAEALKQFIAAHHIRVLNLAGPRSSTEPTIEHFTKSVLREWRQKQTAHRHSCR